jgi:hypothetical protein
VGPVLFSHAIGTTSQCREVMSSKSQKDGGALGGIIVNFTGCRRIRVTIDKYGRDSEMRRN